jgi:hypothetical protein
VLSLSVTSCTHPEAGTELAALAVNVTGLVASDTAPAKTALFGVVAVAVAVVSMVAVLDTALAVLSMAPRFTIRYIVPSMSPEPLAVTVTVKVPGAPTATLGQLKIATSAGFAPPSWRSMSRT